MSANGRMMMMFAFALVVVVGFSLWAGTFLGPPTPIVTIEEASVNPDTTHVNNQVSLSISLKNNDKLNSHQIELQFESHSLVTFTLGSQCLRTSTGAYVYDVTMSPSAELKQPFKVSASLEHGIAELSYQITIKLYADGAQVDTKILTLKVQV